MIAPDMPRHGARWQSGGSLDEIADTIVGQWPEPPLDLGGYSFGGRVALHIAIRHPGRVRRLVLLGATRGIKNDEQRAERRRRDDELAAHIEQVGADQFIDEWLAQPMFAGMRPDPAERHARSGQVATSLAASLREAGTGAQRWLGHEMGAITSPTLAMAGVRDDRFAREASAIARAVSGSFALVPGAGHAAHIEQPEWCATVVGTFLDAPVDRPDGNRQDDAEK